MDLKEYLRSLPDDDARDDFAVDCLTTLGHLRNCIYTPKHPNPATCVLIEKNSAGAVRRWDLRPDDWHLIWPELITAEHPAPEAKAA